MSPQCRVAVLRTYRELTDLSQSEVSAYEAAVRVFRYHHPERPRIQAYQFVADWLDQQESDPDPGGHSWGVEPGTS